MQLKIKYDFLKNIYLLGYFGFAKLFLNLKFLNLLFLKEKIYNHWFELNSGWLVYLLLNGLGFKSTKKIFGLNKAKPSYFIGLPKFKKTCLTVPNLNLLANNFAQDILIIFQSKFAISLKLFTKL